MLVKPPSKWENSCVTSGPEMLPCRSSALPVACSIPFHGVKIFNLLPCNELGRFACYPGCFFGLAARPLFEKWMKYSNRGTSHEP